MTTERGAQRPVPDIALGRRVVLRYRLPAGYPEPLTNVIGELVWLDPPTARAADGQLAVLGIDIDNVVLPQGPSMVRIAPEPDPAWLELYRYRVEDPAALCVRRLRRC